MVSNAQQTELKDWKLETAKYALCGTGVGLFASAFQTAFSSRKGGGAMDMFKVYGSTIWFLAAMGGIFAGTNAAAAQIRGKNDYLNDAAGGCAAGMIAGLRKRSIPAALGGCAFFATTMATYEYSGGVLGTMHGMTREQRDEHRSRLFATAEELRRNQ
ncbi:hypothetical protein EV175_004085 [Coemansia sp. RSA 1933]|nr:hypothetical protein EV175_004085 [Coemansia sp. RSA 1933]